MKIYSWNMLLSNKRFDAALHFIARSSWDIFCLQEVPERFLKRLDSVPCQRASVADAVFSGPRGRTMTDYVVILSRFPIRSAGPISFPDVAATLRSRFFLRTLTGFTARRGRNSAYADVDTGNGIVRVCSLHLALARPADRKHEFDIVKRFIPRTSPAVVAGDFNIIEHKLVKSLHWFTGATVSESLPWRNERVSMEKEFAALGFANPLRGKKTHGISRSQLDHVLVPKDWTVSKTEVVRRTYGSDHHPVFVEVGM